MKAASVRLLQGGHTLCLLTNKMYTNWRARSRRLVSRKLLHRLRMSKHRPASQRYRYQSLLHLDSWQPGLQREQAHRACSIFALQCRLVHAHRACEQHRRQVCRKHVCRACLHSVGLKKLRSSLRRVTVSLLTQPFRAGRCGPQEQRSAIARI